MSKNDFQSSDTVWVQSLKMDIPCKEQLKQRGLCFDSVWGDTVHPAGKAGPQEYIAFTDRSVLMFHACLIVQIKKACPCVVSTC